LLYEPPLSAVARARLGILRDTEDGFRIAEEDLRLRGPGEVLGQRQSGQPRFRFVDLDRHAALLPLAQTEADRLLTRAARSASEAEGLRTLLHLFEWQDAAGLFAAG
jgi:ATP-dependent DNA helicase RecG